MYRNMRSIAVLSLTAVAVLCFTVSDANAQRRGGGSRASSSYRGGGSYGYGGRGYEGGRGGYGYGGFYPGVGVGLALGGYGYGGYGYGGYGQPYYGGVGGAYYNNVGAYPSTVYNYSTPVVTDFGASPSYVYGSDFSSSPTYIYGTNPNQIVTSQDPGITPATYVQNGTSTFSSPGVIQASNSTLVPTTSTQADVARIEVKVPADAKVWFNNMSTTTTGTNRLFESPALQSGHRYTYEFKAQWNENGRPVTKTKEIDVFPGAKLQVDFAAPDNSVNGSAKR